MKINRRLMEFHCFGRIFGVILGSFWGHLGVILGGIFRVIIGVISGGHFWESILASGGAGGNVDTKPFYFTLEKVDLEHF